MQSATTTSCKTDSHQSQQQSPSLSKVAIVTRTNANIPAAIAACFSSAATCSAEDTIGSNLPTLEPWCRHRNCSDVPVRAGFQIWTI